MKNLTVIRYTFLPYFDGYFENGLFHNSSGKPIKEKCYNGRSCINVNNKRYGVKTLRQYAKKQEVELIEMPF